MNGDGLQNDGMPQAGVSGITVLLRFANGTTVTTVSSATGYYVFSELNVPGLTYNVPYTVEVDMTQPLLSNYRSSPVNQGSNDATDSDGSVSTTLSTIAVTLLPSMASRSNLTFDFGLIPRVATVTIGDRVWIDTNRDGLDNDGAGNGVPNIVVTLRDSNGALNTTATNSTGYYRFVSSDVSSAPNIVVANANYTIFINLASPSNVALANYQATRAFVGGNRALDSNGEHSGELLVEAAARTGAIGTSDLDYDFGFIPVFSIGDFVWSDSNGDGVQNAGEPGIGLVTITLTAAAPGMTPRSTTTSNVVATRGFYSFTSRVGNQSENLMPSTAASPITYSLTIRQGEVVNYRGTVTNNAATTDLLDSDFAPISLGTPQARFVDTFIIPTTVPVATAPNDYSHDAGFIPETLIGDYVWFDGATIGVQDASESPSALNGIANVTIELFASTSNASSIASTITDSNGLYYFSSLNVTQITPNTVYLMRINLNQPSLAGYVVLLH